MSGMSNSAVSNRLRTDHSTPADDSLDDLSEEMSQDERSAGVTVVIPAFNEENGIQGQIQDIRRVLVAAGIRNEIIVVDDGSTDGTQDAAIHSGVRLLQHTENRGYGAALKTGIHAACYETIVIIDADGTYPADQIPVMLDILRRADMVVGARIGENVHIPWTRKLAKWFLHLLARQISGQRIQDLNSGLRAFRRDCIMQYFSILSDRFSFTTTSTLAYLADGYRIVNHSIDYHPRIGKSKIVSWHFLDFVVLIVRISMMFNPLRVFVPMSVLFGLLGVAKTIYDIVGLLSRTPVWSWSLLFAPVLSTSAVLLLFIGFQWLMIGMMADGVLRRVAFFNRPLVPSKIVDSSNVEEIR
jgi:glycosyltransferase involved in cell wall biosynthesis